jgi:nucleoside-diphosphate-sugar epimerase
MMEIAVIGAGGFAGGHVAAGLAHRSHRVTPICRGEALPEHRFDAIIDCNGDARRFWGNQNPLDGFRANVDSVVERLTRMRFGRYVYLSTIDVYGEGRSDRRLNDETRTIAFTGLEPYGFQKWTAERQVEFFAPDHLIIRAGTLIGPGLKKNPIYDALNGAPIRQTTDSTLSLLTVGVLVDSLALMLEQDRRGIYNLTGTPSVGLTRVLDLVTETRGRSDQGFRLHPEQIRTRYDINVDKMHGLRPLPDSETMLRSYLEGPL